MQSNPKMVSGPWKRGVVLDKHTVSSTHIGDDENGHPQFDTVRTPIGEALFQLKYRSDWKQVKPLADAIVKHGVPLLTPVNLVVPMPASHHRNRQPVVEIAREVARLLGLTCAEGTLAKSATGQLKNLRTRAEKDAVLDGAFSVQAPKGGPFDVLLVDDLYHTGASMHAAAVMLGSLPNVRSVSVVALTWR